MGIKDLKVLYRMNEGDTSTRPLTKLYKVRVNFKVVFEAEKYPEAFDFYQKAIKKHSTKIASLLNPNYQILERYLVPKNPKPQPDCYSPKGGLDDITAKSEPIHPVRLVQSNPEFNGLAGIAIGSISVMQ